MIEMRSMSECVSLSEAPPGPPPRTHGGVNGMGLADQFRDKAQQLADRARQQAGEQDEAPERSAGRPDTGDRAQGRRPEAQDRAPERTER